MVFTAPYCNGNTPILEQKPSNDVIPGSDNKLISDFFQKHGLGVRAVAIEVTDVKAAYIALVEGGAKSVLAPITVYDSDTARGYVDFAEVSLYGDVVLRLLTTSNFKGKMLPNFKDLDGKKDSDRIGRFGIQRFDHIVGNLWSLQPTMDLLKNMTVSFAFNCFPFSICILCQ